MTSSRPEFKRQESWRYKRVAENWRRPRGVTSKMRKEESGFPAKVKVGFGSNLSTRGLHPRGLADRLVMRESDLDLLDPKLVIVRVSSRVGEKKRLGIIAKAKERNFHIANPGKTESRPVAEGEAESAAAVTTEPAPAIEGETETAAESASETDSSDTAEDTE